MPKSTELFTRWDVYETAFDFSGGGVSGIEVCVLIEKPNLKSEEATMSNRNRIFVGVVILLIVTMLPLLAQAPQGGGRGADAEKGRGGEGRGTQPPPSNLQVLPKDWTRQQVVQVMQGFNMALGVQCNYCHVEQAGAQPNEKGNIPIDGAPDTKQTKKTARVMMKMVGDINTKLGSEIGKPAAEVVRVQCVTCHRGSAIPKTQ